MPLDRIEILKGFLLKDPNDAFVKHALALEYSKTGDDATARRLLEEVLEADGTAVGSYYQLGKLLERTGETALALAWYQRGMNAAKAAGEQRALNELRSAYEDLAEG